MSDECIHLLDPATCTICNGRDRRERVASRGEERHGKAFTAKYAGQCSECNLPISVGQSIVIIQGDHVLDRRRFAHARCVVWP